MAEVVDGLAQQVAAIGLVDGDLRHGEVRLGEFGARGVHPDEDLGDGLDVEVLGQLDDADVVVDDLADVLQHLSDGLAVGALVAFDVLLGQLDQVRVRVEDLRDVIDPGLVLGDGRVA